MVRSSRTLRSPAMSDSTDMRTASSFSNLLGIKYCLYCCSCSIDVKTKTNTDDAALAQKPAGPVKPLFPFVVEGYGSVIISRESKNGWSHVWINTSQLIIFPPHRHRQMFPLTWFWSPLQPAWRYQSAASAWRCPVWPSRSRKSKQSRNSVSGF